MADQLERWAHISGVDGFNIAHKTNTGSFKYMIEYFLPELRQRGRFRSESSTQAATAGYVVQGSDRLRDDHAGSAYKWLSNEKMP